MWGSSFDTRGGKRTFAAQSAEVCYADFVDFRCICANGGFLFLTLQFGRMVNDLSAALAAHDAQIGEA